jgi:hypothetical protein
VYIYIGFVSSLPPHCVSECECCLHLSTSIPVVSRAMHQIVFRLYSPDNRVLCDLGVGHLF